MMGSLEQETAGAYLKVLRPELSWTVFRQSRGTNHKVTRLHHVPEEYEVLY